MASMSKRSGMSDTQRSPTVSAVPAGGGRALANAAEAWFAAAAEGQREMMRFLSMRLEKDAGTTREMIACRNLGDAAAIQSRWVEETLRDYNDEVSKLMAICTRLIDGGAAPRG